MEGCILLFNNQVRGAGLSSSVCLTPVAARRLLGISSASNALSAWVRLSIQGLAKATAETSDHVRQPQTLNLKAYSWAHARATRAEQAAAGARAAGGAERGAPRGGGPRAWSGVPARPVCHGCGLQASAPAVLVIRVCCAALVRTARNLWVCLGVRWPADCRLPWSLPPQAPALQ